MTLFSTTQKEVKGLLPISAEEGSSMATRWDGPWSAAQEDKWLTGESPSIGVIGLARSKTASFTDYPQEAADSVNESAALAQNLQDLGIPPIDCGLEFEMAWRNCQVLTASLGTNGKLLYRALILVGGLAEIASPSLVSWPNFQVSRNTKEFLDRVVYAAARADSPNSHFE